MKKTCFNCKNFCHTLSDNDNPTYHLHYWCKHWNVFMNNTCFLADRYEYKDGIYFDDLETGDAFCYMFEEKEVPMFDDEWFEKNKRENIKNRIVDTD